jgi:hypothetical protein
VTVELATIPTQKLAALVGPDREGEVPVPPAYSVVMESCIHEGKPLNSKMPVISADTIVPHDTDAHLIGLAFGQIHAKRRPVLALVTPAGNCPRGRYRLPAESHGVMKGSGAEVLGARSYAPTMSRPLPMLEEYSTPPYVEYTA